MIIAIPISPEEHKFQINKSYVEYIDKAGHVPFIALPQHSAKAIAKEAGGLLLPGGKDLDPIFYGESNWASQFTDPDKDDFERKLFWAFANSGKPILGICRGFQLIAREYLHHNSEDMVDPPSKGDNAQNKENGERIEDRLMFQQHVESHAVIERLGLFRSVPSHYVLTHPKLLYGNAVEKHSTMAVNSMHHQYLHVFRTENQLYSKPRVTPHMWITAWTKRGLEEGTEGVIAEGFIIRGWTDSEISGVQWHPEELKDYALLTHFFKVGKKPEKSKSTAKGI